MPSKLQVMLSIAVLFSLIFIMGWAACFTWYTEVIPIKKKKHRKWRQ